MGDKLLKVVIAVITLVWAVNFAAPLWDNDYKPSAELNAAFMTVVGGLILAGKSSNNESRREEPPATPPPQTTDEEVRSGADPR